MSPRDGGIVPERQEAVPVADELIQHPAGNPPPAGPPERSALRPEAVGANGTNGTRGAGSNGFGLTETVAVGHFLKSLLRRKWLILGIAGAVLVLSAVQVFTTTPLYTSRAVIQIDPEQPKILPYQQVSTQSFTDKTSQEYLVTQVNRLQTRNLAERVVQRMDLVNDPVFNQNVSDGLFTDLIEGAVSIVRSLVPSSSEGTEAVDAPSEEAGDEVAAEPRVPRLLVEKFLGQLRVAVVRDTRLLEVAYTAPDARLAARIVNTLIDEFVETQFETQFEATSKAVEFLRRQLDEIKARMEESETQLLRYAQANGILDLDERTDINLTRLASLNAELSRIEASLAVESARQVAIRDATVDAFPASLETPLIQDMQGRLDELRRELAGLQAQFGPRWPAVRSVEDKIVAVQDQLRDEKQRAIAEARRDYRTSMEGYKALSEALDRQRRVVEELSEDSIQYNILEREVETNKQLYDGLLQRLKEAGVLAGLRSSNIQLVDDATPPLGPAVPQKSVALVLALLLGLMLGVGAAVVIEALDNTLKTPDEVGQFLNLPALGAIPTLEAFGGDVGVGAPPARIGSDGDTEPRVAVGLARPEQARVLEAYRSLRTSLLLSHSGQPPQVIQVTSALAGEGKTTTAVNTAMVLARTGARTLVVDLDLRKPEMAELFGVSQQQGMTTYLTGGSDLSSQIRETSVPNLFFLPAGPTAPNPPELLGSERMATALALLREYFTYVVIDSPPAVELTDPLMLAPRVDGVLLVARSRRSPRQATRRAAENLRKVGGKLLGVVINDLDVKELEYDFGYYYRHVESETPKITAGAG